MTTDEAAIAAAEAAKTAEAPVLPEGAVWKTDFDVMQSNLQSREAAANKLAEHRQTENESLRGENDRLRANQNEHEAIVSRIKASAGIGEEDAARATYFAGEERKIAEGQTALARQAKQFNVEKLHGETGVPKVVLEGYTSPAEMEVAALRYEGPKDPAWEQARAALNIPDPQATSQTDPAPAPATAASQETAPAQAEKTPKPDNGGGGNAVSSTSAPGASALTKIGDFVASDPAWVKAVQNLEDN